MSLRLATPLLFVAGVLLMVPFEATITLLLGVLCLMGFIVCGVFLIASPGFLDGEEPGG